MRQNVNFCQAFVTLGNFRFLCHYAKTIGFELFGGPTAFISFRFQLSKLKLKKSS